jgi:hypothetical protein
VGGWRARKKRNLGFDSSVSNGVQRATGEQNAIYGLLWLDSIAAPMDLALYIRESEAERILGHSDLYIPQLRHSSRKKKVPDRMKMEVLVTLTFTRSTSGRDI